MSKLADIEGIGPAYAEKLKKAGVTSVEDLLQKGATPKGRKELAETSEIGDALILQWVNHADLFRINGIGGQYSDLLEAAGVDTVVELSRRNAANLLEKMTEVNTQKNLVNRLPVLSMLEKWIEEAKTLPRIVTY
jgi:predicted flap endonuclease-1-like 5' DNA nuclease